MTYALGSISDTSHLNKLAQDHQGKFEMIVDGGDLATPMASYYTLFSGTMDYSRTKWIKYADYSSGTTLVSGCIGVEDKTVARGSQPQGNLLFQ